VLVRNLQAAKQSGHAGEEGEAPLKAALADVLVNDEAFAGDTLSQDAHPRQAWILAAQQPA
jgi:hypothetical protein